MTNFDFEALKRKAGEVADKSVIFAKKTADKAVVAAKVAKINTEIISEKDKVRKAYQEIGKAYYKLHRDDPEEEYAQAIEDAKKAIAAIRQKKADIQTLKDTLKTTDDLGDVVDAEYKDMNDADDDVDIDIEIEIVEDGKPETEEASEGTGCESCEASAEDSIPETEEASEGTECAACETPVEDSIPETEEAPAEDTTEE